MNKWTRPFEWSGATAGPAAGSGASHAPGHLYFAFLSYSHRDSELADWLHRELERFRVPSSLAGRLTPNGVIPPRLAPIFRDRHELAAAVDLNQEIRGALGGSRCLIVLCSPAAAASTWTNEEIAEFKRLHPDGCIIAAIAGGEPFASESGDPANECLPPALRQKYDRRGRATGKRAEPLAADLRGTSSDRRIGFLKIVAGILGVGLDDLVQREHLRRQRRLAAIAGGSLLGMVAAGALAITAIEARDAARDQRREAESLIGFMVGDLKDKLQPLGRLDVLDSVGAKALSYYAKQDPSDMSEEALAQRSRALTLMGEIAQQRGDLNGAFRRYREAMESTGELVRRKPDDGQRIYDHIQNLFWVGYIHIQRGRVAEAADAFREYKRLAERLVEIDPSNTDWRLEPIYADNNLGIALTEQGKYREASDTLREMLSSIEPLVAADPTDRAYQDQLSEALAWLSQARESAGALDEALDYRERQLQLLEQQAKIAGADAPLKLKLLGSQRALGRLYAERGDVERGLQHLGESVRLGDELTALEPENSLWAERRAGSYLDLAELQLGMGRTEAADASRATFCAIANQLADRDPSVVEWRVRLKTACLVLSARIRLAKGSSAQALRDATAALDVAKDQLARDSSAENRFRLVGALLTRAMVARGNGDRAGAERWARAALTAWPANVEAQPRDLANRSLVASLAGRAQESAAVADQLQSIGYRHPAYMRDRRLMRS